jgi:hypothetical protein
VKFLGSLHCPVATTRRMPSKKTALMGDEGKAVGCVPPEVCCLCSIATKTPLESDRAEHMLFVVGGGAALSPKTKARFGSTSLTFCYVLDTSVPQDEGKAAGLVWPAALLY